MVIRRKKMTQTRGLRNNNPLNIRTNEQRFSGEMKSDDPDFKKFRTMAWGYRAAFAILRTYYKRYGLDTISKMVTRWAPSNDGNHTENYIATVSRRSGIPRGKKLHFWKQEMCAIVAAMSYVENGVKAEESEVDEGWLMLVGG